MDGKYIAAAFDAGWQIWASSCICGGKWAWFRLRETGSFECMGCVCHCDLEEKLNEQGIYP